MSRVCLGLPLQPAKEDRGQGLVIPQGNFADDNCAKTAERFEEQLRMTDSRECDKPCAFPVEARLDRAEFGFDAGNIEKSLPLIEKGFPRGSLPDSHDKIGAAEAGGKWLAQRSGRDYPAIAETPDCVNGDDREIARDTQVLMAIIEDDRAGT